MYQYSNILQQRIKGRIGGCITSLVVVLLIAGGLGFFILRAHNGVSISVGAHPTIIGDSCNGPVLVKAGPANQVTIMGIFPQYTQDSAANTIEISECSAGLTLIVPSEANLKIDNNDEVTVLGVSGVMDLSANGSRMTLENVILEGKSKVDDNGGPILFNGAFAQGSSPLISCNGGSIDMTLPANASFNLKFTGIMGPLISDFPGVQISSTDTSNLQFNVGSNPSATKLTLDLNDTDVILAKGA